MNNLNSLIIEGKLKKSDENNFYIVTVREFKDCEGHRQTEENLIPFVAFGRMAEIVKSKEEGKALRIVGRIKTYKYEQDGRKQSALVVFAEHIEFKANASA